MADVELVIKIPEEIYQHYKKIWQKRRGSIPESCIAFGTPLPKGHGRLIDENKITKCEQIGLIIKDDNITRCLKTDAPTIIESDNAESE